MLKRQLLVRHLSYKFHLLPQDLQRLLYEDRFPFPRRCYHYNFFTPASFAGNTFINTEEGYEAVPPGTYTPTFSNGRIRRPLIMPLLSQSKIEYFFVFVIRNNVFFASFKASKMNSLQTYSLAVFLLHLHENLSSLHHQTFCIER